MERLMLLIEEKDVTLYRQFETQSIQPHFFAFRWLTLLFSQEFILPGIIIYNNIRVLNVYKKCYGSLYK